LTSPFWNLTFKLLHVGNNSENSAWTDSGYAVSSSHASTPSPSLTSSCTFLTRGSCWPDLACTASQSIYTYNTHDEHHCTCDSDKPKFHGTEAVLLVASSWHPREDVRNKSCVSCSWTLANDTDTRTNAALHRSRPSADQSGKRVASWTGKSLQTPDTHDLLRTSSRGCSRACRRGCYEDATRKLLSWTLGYTALQVILDCTTICCTAMCAAVCLSVCHKPVYQNGKNIHNLMSRGSVAI